MPNFEEMFYESLGQPITYKNKQLVMIDKFPVKNKEILLVQIEKTNSEWKQGISIDIFGGCILDGELIKKNDGVNMLFWEDTAPKQIELTVLTKKNYVLIKNIWDVGNGTVHSGHHGSAMRVEEVENGRRYYCNDGHSDDNFDDIIFCIQKMNK